MTAFMPSPLGRSIIVMLILCALTIFVEFVLGPTYKRVPVEMYQKYLRHRGLNDAMARRAAQRSYFLMGYCQV
jgi:hypothetical protein